MIKVGIIGYGYWGPNLVRNFSSVEGCTVTYLADSRDERLKLASQIYPNLNCTTDANELLNSNEVDAIVIATPVFTHFDLAEKAIKAGKHVLLEKPMTSTVDESNKLIDLANSKNVQLMVDHTFLYTGAVNKIKDMIDGGVIGKPTYFDSTRINLGLFQPDINVLWDLAPHDISILNFLVNEKPYSVNATGVSHTDNGIENIAYLTLNYQSNFIAHFNCSWTSPVKLRTILIGGDAKMLVFNDLEPSEKIKVYDTNYDHKTDEQKKQLLVDYRTGDIHLPKVDNREALFGMASDFINSIKTGTDPVSSAQAGLDVIKVLEAAQKSIKNNGQEITL